jgi:quinoprotein glucose dehydrogenase
MPPPLHDSRVKLWNYSEEHVTYCSKLLDGIQFDGIFTPPSLGGTLLFPGNGGGTNWGSMAADPDRQIAVLAVSRLPTIVKLVPRKDFRSRARRERGGDLDVQFTEQSGTPYGMARHAVFNPHLRLPCLEGPWGEVVALNMQDGSVLWRMPLGVLPGVEDHPDASKWGSLASGGPMLTASGLLFIADRYRKVFMAMDAETGSDIWSTTLPAEATATPMSYTINDQQFVVLTAGGTVEGSNTPGDYVLAWKLRD